MPKLPLLVADGGVCLRQLNNPQIFRDLRVKKPGTFLDPEIKLIRYRDFVNKELILFSMANHERSIPSMVDGLTPGQRKVLFSAFRNDSEEEEALTALAETVSQHSAYYYGYGENALHGTIVGMAQDYVGSNNINLLLPLGQFGTRAMGGKDHANPRLLYTQLSPLSRFLFPKEDDILLKYLKEEGKSIEPMWYLPIIPMVLVNGSRGLGSGRSSYVPSYNPLDIIDNVKRVLNGLKPVAMCPWYRGFKGFVEAEESGSFTVRGNIEEVDEKTVKITELPIQMPTQSYKMFLYNVSAYKKERAHPLIKDFCSYCGGEIVHLLVTMSEDFTIADKDKKLEVLLEKLKLTTSIRSTNMHLLDSKGVIKKYESPEAILEEFVPFRLEFYRQRKAAMLEIRTGELTKCLNKCRFVEGVVNRSINLDNQLSAFLDELKAKGFTPLPKENAFEGQSSSNYDYLLKMPIGLSTILENREELFAEKRKLEVEVENLKNSDVDAKTLWVNELETLRSKVSEMITIYEDKRGCL